MDDQITPRQENAWQLYQHVVGLLQKQSGLVFDIGQGFKEIKDNKMWRYMGEGGFDTWEQFLSQPDIYLAPQTVRAYIHIYEIYIEKLGLDREKLVKIPFYKLNMLASFVKSLEPEKALDIIESMKELGAHDFNQELNELKGVESKKPIETKREREENELKEIFENMKVDLMEAKDTNQMVNHLETYRSNIMKWHKRFKS